MRNYLIAFGLIVVAGLLIWGETKAQRVVSAELAPLEYVRAAGQFLGPVPLSPAVKVGKLIFVSGTPGYDRNGKLAAGDFSAQMKQAMENVAGTLKAAGAGWDRVVKVNVLLTRHEDFDPMNQIYAAYFPTGQYPARTTVLVAGLPQPDFLLEIECEAAVD